MTSSEALLRESEARTIVSNIKWRYLWESESYVPVSSRDIGRSELKFACYFSDLVRS